MVTRRQTKRLSKFLRVFNNYWYQFGFGVLMGIPLIVEVIITGANDLSQFSILGKICSIALLIDLIGWVGYTVVIAFINLFKNTK